jgi:hypothetical protein
VRAAADHPTTLVIARLDRATYQVVRDSLPDLVGPPVEPGDDKKSGAPR